MSKVIAASMVFVLVIGSGAFAGMLDHTQITQIGTQNALSFLQGEQQANSLQNLVVDNSQCATGMCGSLASESLFASIGEAASAWGQCGNVDVLQGLAITGSQAQAVQEGVGGKMQAQSLGVEVGQGIAKMNGAGYGDALHTVVVDESQHANNAAGYMDESSTVMGMQTSSLYGEPGAAGEVTGTMNVLTTQTQASL
jgi:hypothetical protein